MLSSLRNRVFQTKPINGDGNSTTHLLSSLILQNNQNPLSPIIRIRSFSSENRSSSFVISYLMNSCGLSEDQAISASKKIHFETSSKPDSVLTLLETNGFTKPYISRIITSHPNLLLSDPDKNLKPKLEFFNSIGLSSLELAKVLSISPRVLGRSLENQIIPNIALLKDIVHTDRNVIATLKRSPRVLQENWGKKMVPNIEFLRYQGVPESNIKTFLITQPRALLVNAERFKEIVEEIKGEGFDPLQSAFVLAIHGFTSMSKSTWKLKWDVYKRWGLSEEEIQMAFRKQPICMMASEKKIMSIMDFLVNQMGCSASYIAQHPNILLFSLKKRIIPRCEVLRILVSKGLVKRKFSMNSVLAITEKSFLDKYVIEYEKEVPELRKVYQALLATSEKVNGMNML